MRVLQLVGGFFMEDFHANRVGILAILARVLLRGLVFFFCLVS